VATPAISPTPDITSAAQSLRLDDLLKVLLTELTHQNPFKPVDNKDFMAQIAQFASLNTSQQLNQNIEQLLTLQAIDQSVGLIGRNVTITTESGPESGKVTALTLTNGLPRLTVEAADRTIVDVAIGQLQLVH
jgi:flagellar basal-body rod modification protein FlgD